MAMLMMIHDDYDDDDTDDSAIWTHLLDLYSIDTISPDDIPVIEIDLST